jgi:hypothetical protein
LQEKVKYGIIWPYVVQWIVILWPIFTIVYFFYKHQNETVEIVCVQEHMTEMKVRDVSGTRYTLHL